MGRPRQGTLGASTGTGQATRALREPAIWQKREGDTDGRSALRSRGEGGGDADGAAKAAAGRRGCGAGAGSPGRPRSRPPKMLARGSRLQTGRLLPRLVVPAPHARRAGGAMCKSGDLSSEQDMSPVVGKRGLPEHVLRSDDGVPEIVSRYADVSGPVPRRAADLFGEVHHRRHGCRAMEPARQRLIRWRTAYRARTTSPRMPTT
jgi:hypothetical protein